MSDAAPPSPDPFEPLHLQEGRYRCVRLLGEGSMGRTYLAHDAETGHEVAVKALYPSRLADWKDLELFEREAQVLQRLDHPQIPAYLDAFHEGEGEAVQYFLVQSFVDGRTLREVMGEQRWTEEQVRRLASQLLPVLIYLQRGDAPVVHRDIKPDNIVIRDSDGLPTLVDFGAVREVVRLTMRGGSTIIGTYGYMPPEQLMGRALPATDIYALGVTLIECLTRQTPRDLHGQDVQRLIEAANVGDELRRILRRMCAPGLADRYALAEHVLSDLEASAGGGGALVHAGELEREIAARDAERERALKKASTPGVHLGYVGLLCLIVLSATLAVVFLVQAMAASFQSGLLLAAAISGAGVLMNLVLLGRRYTHDSWEPPTQGWAKTRGEVIDVRRAYVEGQSSDSYWWEVDYAFEARGMKRTFSRSYTVQPREVEIGRRFDLWYRPDHPEVHEMQDFTLPHSEEMARLFDPGVVHTPE